MYFELPSDVLHRGEDVRRHYRPSLLDDKVPGGLGLSLCC